MKMATTTELTYLANLPGIGSAMGVPEGQHLSMRNFYDNEGNVALSSPAGAMIFAHVGDDEYECHWMFIPGSPGKDIKSYAAAMHDEMFTKRGAHVIRGYPPRDNRAVRVVGIALGYTKIEDAGHTDALGRPCEIYEMRREKWVT